MGHLSYTCSAGALGASKAWMIGSLTNFDEMDWSVWEKGRKEGMELRRSFLNVCMAEAQTISITRERRTIMIFLSIIVHAYVS